jgi:alpha-amylase
MHPLMLVLQMVGVGAQHAAPLPGHPAPLPPHPNVCYEIFVRSFYDSNGDGIGDLPGLTQKLDYIKGLGADCIWLMPVAESPSYHGYDVTNYNKIEPDYGTNDDFKAFVAAAHQRGIKVLVDLVLNHVSNEHPYFQEALRDTLGPHRNWFRWSKTGGNNWHKSPVRDEYYYGLFWSGMPDLNFEHPAVMGEAKWVARYWLDSLGVDDFRLDAIRHLIEVGDSNANTGATHKALREYGQYIRMVAPQSYTIGEVWDNVDNILKYYPDELDGYFAFPISEALMDAVRSGTAGPLIPTVLQFQAAQPAWRWAPFQRNHDQTRTMTFLGNDLAGAKLAATILLTLPGLPFVYYGEEIGMTGDKPDERLRTPMQWTTGPAAGFTNGTPWEALQPDSLTANVAAQDRSANSLLNLYRRLIRQRATNSALQGGELIPVETGSASILAYIRQDSARAVLVVANLGKTAGAPVKPPAGYVLRNPLPRTLAPRQAYIVEMTKRP